MRIIERVGNIIASIFWGSIVAVLTVVWLLTYYWHRKPWGKFMWG